MMKSAAQIIEDYREDEVSFLIEYIKDLGGDGLCCPEHLCPSWLLAEYYYRVRLRL